jgi:hypothetical protein
VYLYVHFALCPKLQPGLELQPDNSAENVNIIILHVVLYGCETWSLSLREEHGLRVFENRVLRRIFGLKRDDGKLEKTA